MALHLRAFLFSGDTFVAPHKTTSKLATIVGIGGISTIVMYNASGVSDRVQVVVPFTPIGA